MACGVACVSAPLALGKPGIQAGLRLCSALLHPLPLPRIAQGEQKLPDLTGGGVSACYSNSNCESGEDSSHGVWSGGVEG